MHCYNSGGGAHCHKSVGEGRIAITVGGGAHCHKSGGEGRIAITVGHTTSFSILCCGVTDIHRGHDIPSSYSSSSHW